MNAYTAPQLLAAFDAAAVEQYAAVAGRPVDYEFFLDLEHGYWVTAGSRLHLYADEGRWAMVMEKVGYMNRGDVISAELYYFGNAYRPIIETHGEAAKTSNTKYITLVDAEELGRLSTTGDGTALFELVAPDHREAHVHGHTVELPDARAIATLGIPTERYANPNNLVDFGSLARYLTAAHPDLAYATEPEIRTQLPGDLRKLLTIDAFEHLSVYEDDCRPSSLETYQLIAEVLVTRDVSRWQPTQPPNNHWSNWESGNL